MFLPACTSSGGSDLTPAPSVRVDALSSAFLAAWNAHDAAAFAQTFAVDADFTNVFGVHVHGRPAIEAFHAKIFATVFKNSVQSFDSTQILSAGAGSASVRAAWKMSGATVPGWPLVQHGLISWTLAQQADGSYQIAVMTNAVVQANG